MGQLLITLLARNCAVRLVGIWHFGYLNSIFYIQINSLSILQRNIETCVAPNINIFRENGVSESIITLLQCQPNAFLCAIQFSIKENALTLKQEKGILYIAKD